MSAGSPSGTSQTGRRPALPCQPSRSAPAGRMWPRCWPWPARAEIAAAAASAVGCRIDQLRVQGLHSKDGTRRDCANRHTCWSYSTNSDAMPQQHRVNMVRCITAAGDAQPCMYPPCTSRIGWSTRRSVQEGIKGLDKGGPSPDHVVRAALHLLWEVKMHQADETAAGCVRQQYESSKYQSITRRTVLWRNLQSREVATGV